jgi:tetratricopeptide (TPR) repeat protein
MSQLEGNYSLRHHSQKLANSSKSDYAEAHCNLSITLQELGRLDESEASYKQAIVLKPDYADAYLNLCELLEKTNKVDEALSCKNR